jgi:hypothetical protein
MEDVVSDAATPRLQRRRSQKPTIVGIVAVRRWRMRRC